MADAGITIREDGYIELRAGPYEHDVSHRIAALLAQVLNEPNDAEMILELLTRERG